MSDAEKSIAGLVDAHRLAVMRYTNRQPGSLTELEEMTRAENALLDALRPATEPSELVRKALEQIAYCAAENRVRIILDMDRAQALADAYISMLGSSS